jgi:uncharacterized membrane protein YbhN (UPF0104 family)
LAGLTPTQWLILAVILLMSIVLTTFVLVLLVRGKGYPFDFRDGYSVLNLAQLASMIPGGIWGFAGFTGVLWSKGISKIDSAIILLLHTVVMLTACAMVGVSGLLSNFGGGVALVSLVPFLFILMSRNRLELIRAKYFPQSSSLPAKPTLVVTLLLGIATWVLVGSAFAWLLFASEGGDAIPYWIVVGAYAASYLGGYVAIFAPSGLGVSEGIMAYILSSHLSAERTLSVAVSFRVIHTLIIWANILVSVVIHSKQGSADH